MKTVSQLGSGSSLLVLLHISGEQKT
ncbi:hypothetical protein RDABS01_037019 [Bienertia sinuspersici]